MSADTYYHRFLLSLISSKKEKISSNHNMSKLRHDFRRFVVSEHTNPLQVVFFTQGFWAVLNYRFSRSIYTNLRVPILKQLLLLVMFIWRKAIEIFTGIYLPWKAEIGKGLYIGHFGQIIINPMTKIGENCNLSQGVTIGIKHGGQHSGVPVIGNRVYIGPNAILIGGIEIGNDVLIGAGAVVTTSVPPRAVVAGNPARIISYNGSFDYVHYDDMDSDPERSIAKATIINS